MFTTIETENGRRVRAVTLSHGVFEAQERPMARNYRTVDPIAIAERLREDGFCATVKTRLMRRRNHEPSPFLAGINVHLGDSGSAYRSEVAILCGHDGRTALKIVPHAMRVACENQFTGEGICISHVSREIDAFLAEPARFVLPLLNEAPQIGRKVERLRETRCGERLLNAFAIARPRLADRVLAEASRYAAGEMSLWAVLQAFTEPKRPSLQRIADRLLNEDFQEFVKTACPLALFIKEIYGSANYSDSGVELLVLRFL